MGLFPTNDDPAVPSAFYGGDGLVFKENAALGRGGAVASLSSTFSAKGGLLFEANGAGVSGGAVYVVNAGTVTGEDDWTFVRNAAQDVGGGLYSEAATVTGGHRWFFHENWVWRPFYPNAFAGGIGGAVEAFKSTFTLGHNVTVSYNKGEWATGGMWIDQRQSKANVGIHGARPRGL